MWHFSLQLISLTTWVKKVKAWKYSLEFQSFPIFAFSTFFCFCFSFRCEEGLKFVRTWGESDLFYKTVSVIRVRRLLTFTQRPGHSAESWVWNIQDVPACFIISNLHDLKKKAPIFNGGLRLLDLRLVYWSTWEFCCTESTVISGIGSFVASVQSTPRPSSPGSGPPVRIRA